MSGNRGTAQLFTQRPAQSPITHCVGLVCDQATDNPQLFV